MVVPGRGTRKILREFQIIAARRGHGSAAAAAGGWSVAVIADVHAARPGNTSSTQRNVERILVLHWPVRFVITLSFELAQHWARGVVMLPPLAPLHRAARAATQPSCPLRVRGRRRARAPRYPGGGSGTRSGASWPSPRQCIHDLAGS